MRTILQAGRNRLWARCALLALLTLCLGATANADIVMESSVVAGGGGRSTAGNFALEGTIGQPAAGENLTGGTFTINSGYPSLTSGGQPTVLISQAVSQADPTSQSPINFTVNFSEAVTGFATGDVTLAGTAGATTGTVTGTGAIYNVAVTGMTATGTVVASIPGSVAVSASGGLPNLPSPDLGDHTVTFSTTPIRRVRGQITSQ